MPSGFMCIKKYFQKQKLKKIVGFHKAIGVLSPPYLVIDKLVFRPYLQRSLTSLSDGRTDLGTN